VDVSAPPDPPARAPRPTDEPDEGSLLRRVLLALVALTALGLTVELALLEHVESPSQWVPFVVLAAGLTSAGVVARRATPRALRVFQGVMALCVVAGLAGVVLHYRGNVEFELESDPSARGLDLVWRSLTGATPALAPGALAQLGLLGLAYAYRHPALRRGQPSASAGRDDLRPR
jgi:hypothetical protein